MIISERDINVFFRPLLAVVNISASDDYWSPALDPFENESDPNGDLYPHNPFRLDPSAGSGVLHPSMIVLLVVGMAAFLAAIVVLLIKWQRRRYQDCPWNSSNTVTFLLTHKSRAQY